MQWKRLPTDELLRRLEPPRGRIDMVLDTDAYNEVDDQFALAYALLSPERLNVEAVYAAPFFNDRSSGPADGMQKSYDEILRLLSKMNRPHEGFVYEGSRSYLPSGEKAVDSPAARDLVARALARPQGDPLYVAAIGAATDVASALLMAPEIAEKICVVWLGGHALSYPTAYEFNLMQDVPAARVLFDCGAPLILVPCRGVASHMLASIPELKEAIGGQNPLCDALVELFAAYADDAFGWAKEIWDVAAIAHLIDESWVPAALAPSPLLTDDCHWAFDARRHPIRAAYDLHRNPIFRDLYAKLARA